MAASAGDIKAGRAYVTIGAEDEDIKSKMKRAEKSLKDFGTNMTNIGKKLAIGFTALAAPLVLATKGFARFEDEIAKLQAAANPTEAELEKILHAMEALNQATGQSPTAVAATFTELLKAGLSLTDVMGGAAKATLEFAKVGELDAAAAAVVLADAMNVFEVSATHAADTISKAADASSISIQDVTQSFSQVSAVAKQAGLSIEETATAIAVLGNAGIKGSDAGTSLKTMLLKLQAPAEEGAKMMRLLKINVRDASQNMLPLRGIVGELQNKIGGLNARAKSGVMSDLFGTDAIRAGSVLLDKGTKGLDEFSKKMRDALTVAEKYKILMNTLSGVLQRVWSALERLGVVVGNTLGPALMKVGNIISGFVDGLTLILEKNYELVKSFTFIITVVGGLAATFLALGAAGLILSTAWSVFTAIIGAGVAVITTAVSVLTTLGSVLFLVATPLGAVGLALDALFIALAVYAARTYKFGAAFKDVFRSIGKDVSESLTAMKDTFVTTLGGMANAFRAGDLTKAWAIMWAGLKVLQLEGILFLKKMWVDWGTSTVDVFANASYAISRFMNDAWSQIKAAFVMSMGVIPDTWAAIQTGFINGIGIMEGAFVTFISNLLKGWNNFKAAIAVIWAQIKKMPTGGDPSKEIKKIAADLVAQNKIVDDAAAKTMAAREQKRGDVKGGIEIERKQKEDERTKTVAGIADEQAQRQKILEDQQKAEREARHKVAEASLAGTKEELAAAQANLKKLTDEAAKTAAIADKSKGKEKVKEPAVPGEVADEIDQGMEKTAKKVDIQGTFSAAAAGRMGAGTSVTGLLEEQKKEQEKATKELQKLNKMMKDKGLVFK